MTQRDGTPAQIPRQLRQRRICVSLGKCFVTRFQCCYSPFDYLVLCPRLKINGTSAALRHSNTPPYYEKMPDKPASQGMTSDILARKNADKIRQRTLLPSSQRESATVYQRSLTVQFSCPRATRLSPFVHDLPSQKLPPNGGITQQLSPLRPFPLRSQCRPQRVSNPNSF